MDSETKNINKKHRSYSKSDIIKILNHQKKNQLNNSQLARHFGLSRNTVTKWKRLFLWFCSLRGFTGLLTYFYGVLIIYFCFKIVKKPQRHFLLCYYTTNHPLPNSSSSLLLFLKVRFYIYIEYKVKARIISCGHSVLYKIWCFLFSFF